MKKKVIEASCVLLLMFFSFFYTNEAVKLVRKTDPIMKKIEKASQEREEKATNAIIEENQLTPGYNGKKVNIEQSFQKMKQYGEYNEDLLVFEEIKPSVSMDEYYDKYISSGNTLKEKIALVFEVNENDKVEEIVTALNKSNARGTFFVDGKWLEANINKVKKLLEEDHEVEVLSYEKAYQPILFQNALDVLNSVSNKRSEYCYARYDNKEVIDLCESKKMHTIIPTIHVSTHPFASLKSKVEKGSIIGFEINKEVKEQMGVITNYLRSKGYVLSRLDSLLNEARDEK